MSECISVFDMFKIGVGPSSSHTLGPWKAANAFSSQISILTIDHINITLYGSLSKTGRGHCTDIALIMGLTNHEVETIDPSEINPYIEKVKESKQLDLQHTSIVFDPDRDIHFSRETDLNHPNTMNFTAYHKEEVILSQTYYSIGGGFIQLKDAIAQADAKEITMPYPINSAKQLLEYTAKENVHISEIVRRNEESIQDREKIDTGLKGIINTMTDCVYKGCTTEGILPGSLGVIRRAKKLNDQLLDGRTFSSKKEWYELLRAIPNTFTAINKWVSCFALAVNEENADLGRVVTSPTNGAAGVIPAVMLYYYFFCECKDTTKYKDFLLTASEVGSLFKKGATISAAVGGCQAEIGVSSAMAAAGLTEVLGGNPKQVLMAAEIAMEHHLGLTCDPVGGLVQIPCIERNAMGAMKAITACNLALTGDPDGAKVDLDIIIKTMWDTAQSMNTKYKETSEGGLAIHLPVILPEC